MKLEAGIEKGNDGELPTKWLISASRFYDRDGNPMDYEAGRWPGYWFAFSFLDSSTDPQDRRYTDGYIYNAYGSFSSILGVDEENGTCTTAMTLPATGVRDFINADPANSAFLGIEKMPAESVSLPKIIYNPSFSISAYPNPTNAFATIYSKSPKPGTLSITDLLGKRLYSEQVPPGEVKISLDLRDLPPGSYFATLEEEGKAKASTKITLVK